MKETRRNTARPSKTSDAVEILDRMFAGDDPAQRAAADKAYEDAVVGQLIYNARMQAHLTQGQLAELIGSCQAVISRLENADYEGHSLSMLRRIAQALGKRIEIRFVDAA